MNSDWTYLAALNASNPDNYISYEAIMESDYEGEYPFVDMTPYSYPNPEQILIRKERWDQLRYETKELIEILVSCPREIFVDILQTQKRSKRLLLNTDRIIAYLYRKWGDSEMALQIIKEIRDFLKEGR